MRFYLDDNVSHRVAPIAAGMGLDVVSAREVANNGKPDEIHLTFAAAQGRCAVTRDRDFLEATRLFANRGWPHAGVLLLTGVPDVLTAIATVLARYHELYPAGVPPYTVLEGPPSP
ncbi:MAG: DUF5615 family PIN-like protein [Dehalococcoidia bacterium]